jgi:hypothetical protein
MAPVTPFVGKVGHQSLLVPLAVSETSVEPAFLVSIDCKASRYHCFLSCRWGEFDKQFVRSLPATLTSCMIRGHKVRVFLDDEVLQTAEGFRQILLESIMSTEIFIPAVSPNSLQRMVTHDPEEIDNLLLEWLLA